MSETEVWECPLCNVSVTGNKCDVCGCERTMLESLLQMEPEDTDDLTEEELAKCWECAFCHCVTNRETAERCHTCGISREASVLAFEKAKAEELALQQAELDTTKHVIKMLKHPLFWIPLILISLCFGVFILYKLSFIEGSILSQGWERSVWLETYQEVTECGYIVPEGAVVTDTEQVFWYYEVTPIVTENTAQKAFEYITYTQRAPAKDGQTQTIVLETAVQAEYVETTAYTGMRTTSEPVYRTRYTYNYNKWVAEKPLVAQGSNKVVYDCVYTLASNQKVAKESEKYYIDVQFKNRVQRVYLDFETWMLYNIGDKYVTNRF